MIDRITNAAGIDVSRETFRQLDSYVALLLEANQTQNLIARSSEQDVWVRHIIDSAQLVPFGIGRQSWIDIGSGAGLPGLVIAILTAVPVILVEPRALRAAFLEHAVRQLGLGNVRIEARRSIAVAGKFDCVTARAVAPINRLLSQTLHLAHAGTQFIFPKGRSATSELEVATRTWQGDFRLEPSVTSDDASILIAAHVKPRGNR